MKKDKQENFEIVKEISMDQDINSIFVVMFWMWDTPMKYFMEKK